MPTILYWIMALAPFAVSFTVWGILALSLKTTNLEVKTKRIFTVLSAVYLFGWTILSFWLASRGTFAAIPSSVIPGISIVLALNLPIIIGLLLVRFSTTLKTVINAVPNHFLIGIQLYRVLGAVFVALYLLDTLPAQFALPAGIGDIIVGTTAPVVGYFLAKDYSWSKNLAIAWNVVGIIDFISAVGTGFLTSPGPFQSLAFDHPNFLVTAFPLVLVPAFAVPLSIVLHIISLRALIKPAQSTDVHQTEPFFLKPVKN